MTAAAGVEQSLSQSWLVSPALLVEVKVDKESSHSLAPSQLFLLSITSDGSLLVPASHSG